MDVDREETCAGEVEVLRGKKRVIEKAILPTGRLVFELWITQFVEGDDNGMNLVCVENGKSRQLVRKEQKGE